MLLSVILLTASFSDAPVLTAPKLPQLSVSRPDLPDGVPDTGTWETHSRSFERTLVNDVLRLGGQTLQFIQAQGICPEGSTADCSYRVTYEFRRLMIRDQMSAFTQRFTVTAVNGTRAEGFCWFDIERFRENPQRGALMYLKSGSRWLRMDVDGPPLEQLRDFLVMLAELHPRE